MIAVLFIGLIAAATAAPHHHHSRPPPFAPGHSQFGHYDPFAEDVFDASHFWQEMASEMRQLDEILATFSRRFPTMVSQYGVEGNEYKITIPLNGFDEKDIVVKAKEGFLMVQAVHKLEGGGETIYLDAKTLPACVNVTGMWTFADGVLKIVFPLKSDATTETAVVEDTTRTIIHDKEEVEENNTEDDKDTDIEVGLRGDQERKENELFTNEIPKGRVEATTYAVDLKDDVEFVPVHY